MEKSARPRTALNECVKVVVRCRPLSEKERNEGHEEVVKVCPESGAVQVHNPKGQDKQFTYDAAYDCEADTETIYDEMVRPLVASVLDGFNGCVFAYGQTGTGKTHTMEGTSEHEGIIPRAFRHIWSHIENNASPDVTHLVSCSYVELYLEDVRDLLSKEVCKKLTIRGQELNGFYIPEMTSVVCKSSAEMVRVMRAGNRNRASGRTDMNEHSSRSHAVFLVTVETAHRKTNRIRVGKLNLVDLAGSERQRKTGASADRLREASRINQALSSLGNVISALAENSPHVPYRDSKLTRILQDSLGGNSKTIMIANIGPASYNYDETVTTLRYAHRAKAIKNKPVRNEDPKDAKLREYQAEIERLRALIEQRRAAPERRRKPRPRAPGTPDVTPPPAEEAEPAESLESEHILAESSIEQERSKTEELEAQILALEQRLVRGGGGGEGGAELAESVVRSQRVLEARRDELAERAAREERMRAALAAAAAGAAGASSTAAGLAAAAGAAGARLARALARYAGLREEALETREAHDAERRELEALQAALIGELRRRLLAADWFVPAAGRPVVLRARYSEDREAWELRPPAAPPAPRPARRRRAAPRLHLAPLPLPPTTRPYAARRPPPRDQPAPTPIKKDPELEAPAPRATRRPPRAATAHRLGTAGVR